MSSYPISFLQNSSFLMEYERCYSSVAIFYYIPSFALEDRVSVKLNIRFLLIRLRPFQGYQGIIRVWQIP
jgi:hypothetical protein